MRRSPLVFAAVGVVVLSSLAIPGAVQSLASQSPLDFGARVAARRAIERVYWEHRQWPVENPGPKPSLGEVVTSSILRDKVETSLRLTNALLTFWSHPVSGADLQAEIDREARDSRQPDILAGLWASQAHDPTLVAESLARPILVDRLARRFQATDPRFSAMSFDAWWARVGPSLSTDIQVPAYDYSLPALTPGQLGAWSPTHALPEADLQISAVWTGAEMIIWGGTEVGASKFNSGSRYDPATDAWHTTSGVNAPEPRKQHSAVWTGTEMIVWGGCGLGDEHSCQIATGGRYNPATHGRRRTWSGRRRPGSTTPRCGPGP
jgi:hypothetical protein